MTRKKDNDLWFNRCFSNQLLKSLEHFSPSNLEIMKNPYVDLNVHNSYFESIRKIYSYMAENHRNEYFYKNELFNQLVLPKLKDHRVGALKEWRLGKAICDFITLDQANDNNSTVWEIKSDLDTLKRLPEQIRQYYKAFANVSILTKQGYLEDVEKIVFPETGLYFLDKNNQIQCVRSATAKLDLLVPYAIYRLWRVNERDVITKLEIPYYRHNMSNDKSLWRDLYQRQACMSLDINSILRMTNELLTDRCHTNRTPTYDELIALPRALREWFYFAKMLPKQRKKLVENWNNLN